MQSSSADQNYAFIIFLAGTLTILVFAITLIIFLITNKRKRYQDKLDKLALEGKYQNQLLQTRLEVQEQSFKYFSEEIHDNIGQILSIVKMQLYTIKTNSTEKNIIAKATDSTDLLGKAITDLRNISHTLNSAYVENAGLLLAIQKDLDYISSAKDGLQCKLHSLGVEYSLGNETELLVFRIVQEATANAIKHGAPTAIDIFLDFMPDHFGVRICDNGTGFDAATVSKPGLGMNNMHERSTLLKGILQVKSEKEKGTTVELRINHTKPITDNNSVA